MGPELGGSCEAQANLPCADHFSVRRVVSAFWSAVRSQFADLRLEGWGKPATWDAHRVLELPISAYLRDLEAPAPGSLNLDLWIDDTELF